MTINKTDVEKISLLAKIRLSESETSNMQKEISKILEMISQLDQIDTKNIEPLSHPISDHTHYREDVVTEKNDRENLMKFLNYDNAGLYLVPKVIE